MNKKYDVGILGVWPGCNYGSIATYYALNKVISSYGYSVLMIDKPRRNSLKDVELSETHSRRFAREHYDVSDSYRLDELEKLNDLCDTFVMGSDQVWNYGISKNFGKAFYLAFAHNDKKLISYASSFGHGIDFATEEQRAEIIPLLQRFDAISVREESGVRIAKDFYQVEATHVLDPVFLADASIFHELADKSTKKEEEPFIATYILDPTPEKKEALLYASKKLGCKLINMLDGMPWLFEENKKKMDLENCVENLQVEDWLYYFKNCKFAITDSCHGASFSLVFQKTFIPIANKRRGFARFESLCNLFGIKNRLVTDPKNILTDNSLFKPMDYTRINAIMDAEKRRCGEWLETNLRRKKNTKSVDLILDCKKDCTGCSSCRNSCPVDAITMLENKDGFLNPSINKNRCTNCGLCAEKCPVLHSEYNHLPKPSCFAMMANNEIRRISSSGGMFTVAAEHVLSQGGYVCGAAYKDDFRVEHIIINSADQLHRLRGSKYMQSDVGKTYQEVKHLLNKNNYVLYTGLPCQIAGLYAFLGKDYENLITMDLLCHGITSSKVFEKYHKDVLGGKPLKDVKFKAKEPWGWHAGVNADFSDGTKYSKPLESDKYFIAYLKSISKNRACGACVFNRLPRQGDLTIGDFWGVVKYNPSFNDNKGTSVVLLNSQKGEDMFKRLKKKMILCEETPLAAAIAGNRIIEKSYSLHKNRNEFFENFDDLDFSSLTDGCYHNKLYNKKHLKLLETIPAEHLQLYYLAEAVAKNYRQRKVVLWGDSPVFSEILKKHFDITVSFVVSIQKKLVNGTSIKDFSELKGLSRSYYLVSMGKAYEASDYKKLNEYGYTEIKDFIFKIPKPVVLENYDCSKGNYSDIYGNTVEGFNTVIKKIVFRSGNNHIMIGEGVRGTNNLQFDLTANSTIRIDKECVFGGENTFKTNGHNGYSFVSIGMKCRFLNSLFKLYNNPNISGITINENCTFETNLEMHANSGKKIIIGRDCMFSHGIDLWAGDGHSMFDVKTGKNTNSLYDQLPMHKNLLVIGEHVWIGKNAFVMHGTNIGDGSIVGAMSVVKGRYPNNCVVGGNPAAIAKRDAAWSRDMCTDSVDRCGGLEYVQLTSPANAPISGLNVLVIGGTKFMGVQLVKELLRRGNRVTIATRGNKADAFEADVTRLIMDVSDEQSVKRALSGKQYDVVFDNLAYCSLYANNVLSNVKCKKYIQLSAVEAYGNLQIDMRENHFDPYSIDAKICDVNAGYVEGKRQAEAVAYQNYKHLNISTVRLPYVTRTDRLYYYCKHIVNQTPMNIDDTSRCFTFIRDTEVGKFLPWLAAQNTQGPINLASVGSVTIQAILDYIEKKVGKKAIIDTKKGTDSPFHNYNEKSYSLSMAKATQLGYHPSDLNDWFWPLMDAYIERAIKEKK